MNSGLAFTSSATPNPSAFAPGAATVISAAVKDAGTTGLTNSIVELQVFNSSGTAVMTTYWTGQNFSAGQTLPYSYTWTSPTTLATGAYSVEVGVFNSSWSTNYYWNGSAGSITVTSSQPPAAPTGLTASAGSGKISLSWTASSGASSYNVYRGTTAGGESATPLATNVTTTTYADTTAAAGTKYYYKVAAVNTSGTSSLSNEASAAIPPSPPPAPTGLIATKGNKQVSLKWIASTGATSYNVYRGTSPGGEGTTPIATGITSTSYTNSGLTNGKTYYYKVAAVNAAGTSPLSNEASATPAK